MEIPHPSAQVIEAVKAGVAWLEKSAIQGIRIEKVEIKPDQIINEEYPYDLKVVKDKKAPRIWARFYELDTNKPFMARRDGTKVYQLSDVDPERRTGYDWYTYAPEAILKHYPQWLAIVEAEQAYAGYEVLNNMPAFYQQLKQSLTYPLAWGNAPEKDFNRWRAQAREKLLECMQPAPPQADFDMKVIESEQREGYTAQKIVFNVSGYSRVPAYLLVPEGKVLSQPYFSCMTTAHTSPSEKEKMVRPFNVSETVMQDADDWAVRCYDGQYVGDFLARNGYVVLAVDALFWGERGRKRICRLRCPAGVVRQPSANGHVLRKPHRMGRYTQCRIPQFASQCGQRESRHHGILDGSAPCLDDNGGYRCGKSRSRRMLDEYHR